MSNRAWVTLATNDSYGLGALVLAHSLRRVGSAYPAAVLVTPAITDSMRDRLSAVFAEVITVDVLDSRDAAHLALLQRPELGITFTKIHCWSLTQYEKCVFLDADTLVVQNCDELFEREELSAAPDVGWPDCFNSGVFVFKPSKETFDSLIKFAQERGSFDGGDQGLLNSYFSDWARADINKHLPFLYNVTSAAFYSYLPAFKEFGQDLKIIHFIGIAKPWLQNFNWDTQSVDSPDYLRGTLQLWWDIFVSSVHQQLDANMVEEIPTEVELPEEPAYYKPEIDPSSEFPWHHANPDKVKEEEDTHTIDMTQIHDPWAHYKGDIPLSPDQEPNNSNTGAADITPELREYIWEYKQAQEEHDHAKVESYTSHSHDRAHWESPSHHDHSYQDMRQSGYQRHEQTHHHHVDHNHVGEHSWTWKVDVQVNSHSHNHPLHAHTLTPPHATHNHESHKLEQMQVHRTDVKPEKKRVRRRRPCTQKRRVAIEMNGDLSGSDTENTEMVIPRHPYDGFYLRHRSTFDARGRKMCTHEVPPSPVHSPPPSPLPEITEETIDQTGVAGVLARVATPGAPSSERGAAIDELTRRQGWEQGNIDYMGADSFDNIWAKISQTLKQAPVKEPSPSKEVRQSSPPKEPVAVRAPDSPAPAPAVPVPAPVEEIPAHVEPAPAPPAPVLDPAAPAEKGTPAPSEPVPEPAAKVAEKQPSPSKELASVTPSTVPESPAELQKSDPKDIPAVPPTPPVTPKSTPEPSTPVSESVPVEVSTVAPVVTEAAVVQAPALVETSVAPVEAPATPEVAPAVAPETRAVVPEPVAVAPESQVIEATAAQSVLNETPVVPVVAPETPAVVPESVEVAPESQAVEAIAAESVVVESPVSPVVEAVAPALPIEAVEPSVPSVTPEKSLDLTGSATDSPPLAHTPGKEELGASPAKSVGERARKPAGKLTLSPPAVVDALPTPDSELEDAASLAQSIIARELAAPALAPPTPATPAPPASPPAATQPERLAAETEPLDTPPAGPVSLAQIGVKAKPTIAAQIESSLAEPGAAPAAEAASGAPKKKLVKKVVKKDGTASGDAPVPPPRKKEKKPKDK